MFEVCGAPTRTYLGMSGGVPMMRQPSSRRIRRVGACKKRRKLIRGGLTVLVVIVVVIFSWNGLRLRVL
ncbi:MAG: hypothetical protein Kow0077_11190 [Anaerolineae bacterium]